MFSKTVFLTVTIMYVAYYAIPWLDINAPSTVSAIKNLGQAMQNDTRRLIYNQTMLLRIITDSKMLEHHGQPAKTIDIDRNQLL